jgi:large subunit ribosomal protein L14e
VSIRAPVRFTFLGITTDLGSFFFLPFFFFLASLLYQNPTTMSFNRFVQIGRVCLINYGDDEGKLCTIIDVVDSGRALVDGPTKITGVTRQIVPFKRLSLTDYVVKIGRNARQKSLNKAWATDDIKGKWDASAWAKKRAAAKKRATTNDFGRFRAMLLKKKRTQMVKKAAAALRK